MHDIAFVTRGRYKSGLMVCSDFRVILVVHIVWFGTTKRVNLIENACFQEDAWLVWTHLRCHLFSFLLYYVAFVMPSFVPITFLLGPYNGISVTLFLCPPLIRNSIIFVSHKHLRDIFGRVIVFRLWWRDIYFEVQQQHIKVTKRNCVFLRLISSQNHSTS